MSTTLFQLCVRGPDKNGTGKRNFYSKKIFSVRSEAEGYLPKFSARCTGNGILDLERIEEHAILELELQDQSGAAEAVEAAEVDKTTETTKD
jgi:hypothetical protein